ncbi:MAG: HEPN domain-containing protein [Chlorobi bacterium]|nr:HEPN domain-containing protein [Chlorobiota bacterium]
MTEKVKYWVDLSDYDFDTALAMLNSERYLYVGFMCHQTVEKIFKAYFVFLRNENPPFSHSLSYIAKNGGFYKELNENLRDFIDQIEPLNIEARYPTYKNKLLKSLNKDKCAELIKNTKVLREWIKKKL